MKKRWLFVLIPLLLAVNILAAFPFSLWSRVIGNRKAEWLPKQMQASFESHADEYLEAALAMSELQEEHGLRASFACEKDRVQQSPPGALGSDAAKSREKARLAVSDLLKATNLSFDRIFISHPSVFYYPEDAVVFRCVVMDGQEEYCWVDLIYSPQWQQHKAEKRIHTVLGKDMAVPVAENWCIVTLYLA